MCVSCCLDALVVAGEEKCRIAKYKPILAKQHVPAIARAFDRGRMYNSELSSLNAWIVADAHQSLLRYSFVSYTSNAFVYCSMKEILVALGDRATCEDEHTLEASERIAASILECVERAFGPASLLSTITVHA